MNPIDEAVEILKQGGLVGMPTETVYGLAADARNPHALRKIFAAKQRPVDHPLIVHIADFTQLSEWARDVSPMAVELAKAFWPGPLTMILPKAVHVLDLITGGQDTVGVRIPRHPVAQAILKSFAGGVAAPSANRFGRVSPTTAEAVRDELGDSVDLVIEGGQCEVGIESTIVDLSREDPVILRPGMITAKQVELVLHAPISTGNHDAPRVSGSLESHYAPQTPTYLVLRDSVESFLNRLTDLDLPCALLSRQVFSCARKMVDVFAMPMTAEDYAHDLYQMLRRLDKMGFKKIFIEAVPDDSAWDAIRDRLRRATLGTA